MDIIAPNVGMNERMNDTPPQSPAAMITSAASPTATPEVPNANAYLMNTQRSKGGAAKPGIVYSFSDLKDTALQQFIYDFHLRGLHKISGMF